LCSLVLEVLHFDYILHQFCFLVSFLYVARDWGSSNCYVSIFFTNLAREKSSNRTTLIVIFLFTGVQLRCLKKKLENLLAIWTLHWKIYIFSKQNFPATPNFMKKREFCWKGELLQLIWRWFWWCPRLHFMCITSLELVMF